MRRIRHSTCATERRCRHSNRLRPMFVANVRERIDEHWNFSAFVHDALAAPIPGNLTPYTFWTFWNILPLSTKTSS